jgi:DNA repair ATPase RecN
LNKQTQIEQEFAGNARYLGHQKVENAVSKSFIIAKYQKYRHALKSIRERENSMTEVREKKKALLARIAALEKSNPKSSKVKEFQHELASLANDTRDREADIADFKRFALREAFYLRFNAMAEYAEKTALLAGFGKVRKEML